MRGREIARQRGRDPGTVSRELRRTAAPRNGQEVDRAGVAQWKAQQAAKRPTVATLVTNPKLRDYVQQRLAGQLHYQDGTIVTDLLHRRGKASISRIEATGNGLLHGA